MRKRESGGFLLDIISLVFRQQNMNGISQNEGLSYTGHDIFIRVVKLFVFKLFQ